VSSEPRPPTLLDLVRREFAAHLPSQAQVVLDAVTLDSNQLEAIIELNRTFRASGKAPHVTVAKLVGSWWQIATTVDSYPEAIDDYTNDLCVRDLIDDVLESDPGRHLDSILRPVIDAADAEFWDRTRPDDAEAVGRFFNIASRSGWWWRRRPTGGPLADYLSRVTRT
jgi:hypothetical protein